MYLAFLLPLLACLITFACCFLVMRNAQKWMLIDKPNFRSSHLSPTPSGGGLGLVIAGVVTGFCLVWYSNWAWRLGAIVMAASFVLAVISLLDDLRPMRASHRLTVQLIVSSIILLALGGLPEIERLAGGSGSRTILYPFLILVILWWINLFNFMDGIDGLAGSQAIFMLLAGAGLLAWLNPAVMSHPMWLWMICIAGGVLGFLFLNWSPAKIFMGDVGSIYLAVMIMSLALMSIRYSWIPVSTGLSMWVILGAIFVADSTVTLWVRMATGQPWREGHRSHTYQQLARRWGSHRGVTLAYISINLLWILPLASACIVWPEWSLFWIILAYFPLVLAAFLLSAGRPY